MSNLIGIPAVSLADRARALTLIGADEPGNAHEVDVMDERGWLMAASHLRHAPLPGPRTYRGADFSAIFAGDLVDHDAVPFKKILVGLRSGDTGILSELNGVFCLIALEHSSGRIFAITDRRGQKPLFYRMSEHGVQISSCLSTFVRVSSDLTFDSAWLWESLYFNYPVDDTTFLKGVERIPSASVMIADGSDISISEYVARFTPKRPLHGGRAALELARDTFAARMSPYYRGAPEIACALTAGWDGRTMLALAPPDSEITAYTYGNPGCADLSGAAATADAVGTKHLQIPFDDAFVSNLPQYAMETVYLSSGLQGVLRSTLLYAYSTLTEGGDRFPLTISGIAMDMLFRGHAHCPDLIAPDIEKRFRGYRGNGDTDAWLPVFGNDFSRFSAHVESRLSMLTSRFGPFENSSHHLSYIVYPLSTHNFCGELAISDLFTTVRVPCWDSQIIELAYNIEQSTQSYSQFLSGHKRGAREEVILQAYLFKELAPHFYDIPVGGIRPAAVLAGGVAYRTAKVYRGVVSRLKSRSVAPKSPPLENWSTWMFDRNQPFVMDLLKSPDTRVTEYVDPTFVDTTISARDLRMLGKLLTAEIILRLIRNQWRRFW